MMPPILFDHYVIRLLDTDDLLPYFALVERNRDRLNNFFTGTVSRTQTLEDTKTFLADITERARARTYLPYLIVDTRNGAFAGFLDLKNIDWTVPKSEVGCYMDESYAARGLATKAFRTFCNHCFAEAGFKKLFLRTHHTNTAAIRMAESSGFQKEGILRWDYKTTSGELVDLLYYGRLDGAEEIH